MRPYEIEFGAGTVFPTENEVGAQLDEIEVGFGERVGVFGVSRFVHDIVRAVVTDFVIGESVEALVVVGVEGVGDISEVLIHWTGDVGLGVVLNGEFGGDVVVEPEGKVEGFLADFSNDVAGLVVDGDLGYILVLSSPIIRIACSNADVEGVGGLQGEG